VVVIGEDPIGFSQILTQVPAQFTIAIPADVSCREYSLTALGTTTSKQNVRSDPVLIDVERLDLPISFFALSPGLTFNGPGQILPIMLVATFSDGKVPDITEFTKVSYTSRNTKSFTIDKDGIVTARAPGLGAVTATYSLGNRTIQAQVAITVYPAALAPSAYSLSFGNQNAGTSSVP
jgi:hypothetical protein